MALSTVQDGGNDHTLVLMSAQPSKQSSVFQLDDLVASVDGILFEADPVTCEFLFVSKQAEAMLGFPCSA